MSIQVGNLILSVADTATFTEAMKYVPSSVLASMAETVTFTEVMQFRPGTLGLVNAETANFQEAVESPRIGNLLLAIGETLGLQEANAAIVGAIILTLLETAEFAEVMQFTPGILGLVNTDTLDVQEAVTGPTLSGLLLALSETLEVQEANAVILGAILLAIAETAEFAEVTTLSLAGIGELLLPVLTEALNFQEDVSAILGGLNLSASDTIAFQEIFALLIEGGAVTPVFLRAYQAAVTKYRKKARYGGPS